MTDKNDNQDDGGVKIGGNVSIGRGDFIGRDKKISVAAGGTNVEGDMTVNDQAAVREELFEDILKKIEQRPDTPPEDTEVLKTNVREFKAEVDKGDQADESFLAARFRNIKRIAPDIGEVLLTSITNPAAGFALVVKKVAERAKSQGSQTTA
jgi:hypothetical protein